MLHKEKNFVSAIVYLHNAETEIEQFLSSLIGVFDNNFEKYEIIIVNDASTDKGKENVKEFAKSVKSLTITIIDLSFFQGLEAAMIAGVDIAIGDFIYEFDSPFIDYSLKEVMGVYNKSMEGFDIVSTSPNKKLKLTSRFFYSIFEVFSQNRVRLYTETFRILSRRAVNRINILNERIPYRKAIYFNCGLNAINIRYDINEQKTNRKQNYQEKFDVAINALIIFTDLSTKFSALMALIMLIISIGVGLYTIITFLTYQNVVEGWTTTMLFLSFSFTSLFILVSILIKYLSLILSLHFTKQSYVIESVEKIK